MRPKSIQPGVGRQADGNWADSKAAQEFMRLAAEYQVDVVFSGHIHMYNRIDEGKTADIITAGAV